MNFLINVHQLVDDSKFKEYCTNVQKIDYDFMRDVLELYYYSRNEYSEVYKPDQFLSLSHKLIPLFRTSLQGPIATAENTTVGQTYLQSIYDPIQLNLL